MSLVAKGVIIETSKRNQKLIMIPKALEGLLRSQFPANATCWSRATNEVRDMCRYARGVLDAGEHPVNFSSLKTPALWNDVGVTNIIRFYTLMSEHKRDAFIEHHQEWIEAWLQEARARRGSPVDTRTLYQRVCNGNTLTDKEVTQGHAHFYDLSSKLYASGPEFVIAAKEAGRIADVLRGFANARKLVV